MLWPKPRGTSAEATRWKIARIGTPRKKGTKRRTRNLTTDNNENVWLTENLTTEVNEKVCLTKKLATGTNENPDEKSDEKAYEKSDERVNE